MDLEISLKFSLLLIRSISLHRKKINVIICEDYMCVCIETSLPHRTHRALNEYFYFQEEILIDDVVKC